MKKLFFLSAVATALLLSACGNSTGNKVSTTAADTTKMKTGDAYYQCPMHPEVISDKPGTCEKCGGMELQKMEKK